MTIRKPPEPPGPSNSEVRCAARGRPDAWKDPEPLDDREREWRVHVVMEMRQAELVAMDRELHGAVALEASLADLGDAG